jgi:hypothetical protein
MPAVAADTIYAKTARGREEVAQRLLGLSARQRSVLIMVDGRRPSAALAELVAGADIVGELLALGLIAAAAAPAQPAAPAPAPPPTSAPAPPPAPAPAQQRAVPDVRLAAIKRQMTTTAETYLGLMAADVVRRIERAADEAQLQSVLGHWHMALQESKHGKAVALAQLELVRASFAAP